jgi:hypothetical protein
MPPTESPVRRRWQAHPDHHIAHRAILPPSGSDVLARELPCIVVTRRVGGTIWLLATALLERAPLHTGLDAHGQVGARTEQLFMDAVGS